MNKALIKRQQQRITNGNTNIIRNKYGSNQFSINLVHENNHPFEFDILTEDNHSERSSLLDDEDSSSSQDDNSILTEDYLLNSIILQSGSINNDIINEERLFESSDHTIEDVILLIELIKTTHNLGDRLESILIGLLAVLLPKDNIIKSKIIETSNSIHYYQKLIQDNEKHLPRCSVHKIEVCRKGCFAFVGPNYLLNQCPHCFTNRRQLHGLFRHIYYFPIKERLLAFIKSDLSNFLNYNEVRHTGGNSWYQDVYDGKNWKRFVAEMDNTKQEKLLALQWCWDGADVFEFSGKVFWPSCLSILNLPLDLRSKPHIGMHVVSICDGKFAST